MITNPFITSGRIPTEYFCDRVNETAELTRLLTNGNNVVLVSARRMGKTGLIRHFFEQPTIKNNYYTFFIDILQTNSLQELIFLLGKEVYSVLAPRSRRMALGFVQALKSLAGKFSFDNITGMPIFSLQLGDITKPEITLEEIFSYLADAEMPCIVAIDEFQQIAEYSEKNIEAFLRSHIQQSTNCNFIFSGSRRHILHEMFHDSARPFYNSASLLELVNIPENLYTSFICKMFSKKDKHISNELARMIYGMYNGHTFYVQRTCNEAFSFTSAGGECTKDEIILSVSSIINSYSTFYRETLSSLPVKQKQVLYAIAQEGKASNILSENFVKKYALASASSVQSAARLLEKRDLITRANNSYFVTDLFFGMWLKQMFAAD